jgi:hypothetical protein
VAYAAVSGSSADLRFGIVERINRNNSEGKPIMRSGKPSCSVTLTEVTPDGAPKKAYSWQKTKSGRARLRTILNVENIVAIKVTPDDIDGTVEKLMELHESLEGGTE